jgi:hypothetical protein
MPNKSTLASDKEANPIEPSSQTESANHEQEDALAATSNLPKTGNSSSRKTALSKREIMEELSRQRFPWDE